MSDDATAIDNIRNELAEERECNEFYRTQAKTTLARLILTERQLADAQAIILKSLRAQTFIDQSKTIGMLTGYVAELRFVLKTLGVGSCKCLTKTPDVKHHAPGCCYRRIAEVLEKTATEQQPSGKNEEGKL